MQRKGKRWWSPATNWSESPLTRIKEAKMLSNGLLRISFKRAKPPFLSMSSSDLRPIQVLLMLPLVREIVG